MGVLDANLFALFVKKHPKIARETCFLFPLISKKHPKYSTWDVKKRFEEIRDKRIYPP